MRLIDADALKKEMHRTSCDTCKHSTKGWDEYPCDGCTTADSHWERNTMMDRDRELHEMADEGRALMSDYIRRVDAINAVANTYWQGTDCECYAFAHKALDNVPTIDAVPVVRCKECKWWTKQEKSIQGRCALNGTYPTGGWYCANGRRDDE